MLIAQITDLHIGLEPISALNDARLERVVARLNAIGPDLVLATGDLTESGDTESYARLKAILAGIEAPVWSTVGNHDRRAQFLDAFPETPTSDGFVQYAIDLPGLHVIVLDTLEEGRHGGAFCALRARWLSERLAAAPDRPTLIALHHPPAPSGIAWMDAGAEGDWSRRLFACLTGHSRVVGIVSGHVHRPAVTVAAGLPLVIAPSTAPEVGLDLRPIDADRSDRRPLIVEGAPGLALHLWRDGRLTTHFDSVGDERVLARYDDQTQPMVQDLMADG
ncbi:MAG: phosphodiesterase [Caulobacteraceae bacterium]|nr:MAG: phosphodiesterase [Caulobacteraceae bacterium]